MKKLILLIALVTVSSEVISQQSERKLARDSINIDGLYRFFEYFIPVNLMNASSLIFVLHGSNGSVAGTRSFTSYEFENIADKRKNYVIVYPEGYDKHWNDCRKNASYAANTENINDIGFFSSMIEYFAKKFNVDSNAIFATGISNGGHMCYKLAYEMPNKIKGIAPFVANTPVEAYNDCIPRDIPISVLIINGTADPINPYKGGWVVIGQDSTLGVVNSTVETLNYWKSLLPCNPNVEIVELENIDPNDSSTIKHYKYFCKDSKVRIELLKVINGGHSVPLINAPDLPPRWREILGNTNNDVNSPLLVVDFFNSLK